jgi:predicted DNA-binding transcriptional regulator AlpA
VTQEQEQELITAREVAELLQVGRSTVHRLVEAGELVPVNAERPNKVLKRVRRYYFKRADVLAYIARLECE